MRKAAISGLFYWDGEYIYRHSEKWTDENLARFRNDGRRLKISWALLNKAFADGRLSVLEANTLWRMNKDFSFKLTVDASKLEVKILKGFDSYGYASGVVQGSDWMVHGTVMLRKNEDETISIPSGMYDFLPNLQIQYSSWWAYAERSINTYIGFYVASFAGIYAGQDYLIEYSGQPEVIDP